MTSRLLSDLYGHKILHEDEVEQGKHRYIYVYLNLWQVRFISIIHLSLCMLFQSYIIALYISFEIL